MVKVDDVAAVCAVRDRRVAMSGASLRACMNRKAKATGDLHITPCWSLKTSKSTQAPTFTFSQANALFSFNL